MAYIVQRKDRYYVIAYDGIDPTTGRERRRWHPVGHSRTDAEAIAHHLESVAAGSQLAEVQQLTLGSYLNERWMPRRRQTRQPTTAYRYQWIIDHYIDPALGSMPLRSVRAEHLDRFYTELLASGGRHARGLAPKTVYDVHVVIRAGLNQALRQHLVTTNVAHAIPTTRPFSPDGTTGRSTRGCRPGSPTRSSPTPTVCHFTRSRSPNSSTVRSARSDSPHPLPRSPSHPRVSPGRRGRADQGRVRTPRARSPRLHHDHLPTRPPRHGRRCRPSLRPTAGQRDPVDVVTRRERRRPGTQWFRAFQMVAGEGFEPSTFGL